jgi:hypothetical protein
VDQLAHGSRSPQRERQLHLIRHLIADPALRAPRLRSRQHQPIAGAPAALPFLETGRAVAPVGSAPPADRAPMHSHRQRRRQVCRALLNKKNRSMAQSFLRLLIQFAGIAKMHLGKLSQRIRYVICLFRILVICFPRCARWPHPACRPGRL